MKVLHLPKIFNILAVKVASDCLGVVTNLQRKAIFPYAMILQEMGDRTKHFNQVNVVHERREAVGEALSLAKATSSLEVGPYIWLGFIT